MREWWHFDDERVVESNRSQMTSVDIMFCMSAYLIRYCAIERTGEYNDVPVAMLMIIQFCEPHW